MEPLGLSLRFCSVTMAGWLVWKQVLLDRLGQGSRTCVSIMVMFEGVSSRPWPPCWVRGAQAELCWGPAWGVGLSFSSCEMERVLFNDAVSHPLQYSWASLVPQLVKNLPALWDTWVWSLGWEGSLEKGKSYPLQYSGLENYMDYSPCGCKESDTT